MKSKDLKKLTKFFKNMDVEAFSIDGISVKFWRKETINVKAPLTPLDIEQPILSDDDLKIADARNLYWSSYNAR